MRLNTPELTAVPPLHEVSIKVDKTKPEIFVKPNGIFSFSYELGGASGSSSLRILKRTRPESFFSTLTRTICPVCKWSDTLLMRWSEICDMCNRPSRPGKTLMTAPRFLRCFPLYPRKFVHFQVGGQPFYFAFRAFAGCGIFSTNCHDAVVFHIYAG